MFLRALTTKTTKDFTKIVLRAFTTKITKDFTKSTKNLILFMFSDHFFVKNIFNTLVNFVFLS